MSTAQQWQADVFAALRSLRRSRNHSLCGELSFWHIVLQVPHPFTQELTEGLEAEFQPSPLRFDASDRLGFFHNRTHYRILGQLNNFKSLLVEFVSPHGKVLPHLRYVFKPWGVPDEEEVVGHLRQLNKLWKRGGLPYHVRDYDIVAMRPQPSPAALVNTAAAGTSLANMDASGISFQPTSPGLVEFIPHCESIRRRKRRTGASPRSSSAARTWLWEEWSHLEPPICDERARRLAETAVGYVVSKYVLSIRDGHEDNIMLADDGSLFRVQLGSALGRQPLLGSKGSADAPLVSLPVGLAHVLERTGRRETFVKNSMLAFRELQKDEQFARTLRDAGKSAHQLETWLETPENFDDRWQSGRAPHFKLDGRTTRHGPPAWKTPYPQNPVRPADGPNQPFRFDI